ncbi:hypothetical protein HHK36_016597 [Tetracentron sinense]|uniref:Methyltransferase type 11 domain-containing protein n=1 Tax=Tetracentron sinense TaxID=13715 RepID=A0A834Z321_TETSI|nr:hypothetical protein HHK36_016597 [Tetracentron sinense]
MAFKVLKLQILHGSIVRRLLLRAFLFALFLTIFPLLQFIWDEPTELSALNSDDCGPYIGSKSNLFPAQFLKPVTAYGFPLLGSSLSMQCKENMSFTISVFRDLIDKGLLNFGAKALCVGDGSASAVSALRELGFSDASGVYRHHFFSLKRKQFIYELEFRDNSFDFVFSRALDKVSVPALLMLEIERVLRPGGVGAMLVGASSSSPGSLIRSATPVSSFLRCSNVVYVCSINSSTLVVFKKRFDTISFFEQYRLPDECPSVINNKPFMKFLEPLADDKPVGLKRNFTFLPKFMDMSSKRLLIHINVGIGKFMNSSATNWFLPIYPDGSEAFKVYVVDHNTSVLSSCVKKPGITFVYHPGLAGNKDTANFNPVGNLSSSLDDEGFDFLVWFKETVAAADFVVLKMNAGGVELKLLFELFKSGDICLVDELFLRCSDSEEAVRGDCMELFKGLRTSGVFVHQWWGD